MLYQTILFDADGTLLDFSKAQEQAFLKTCEAFGVGGGASLVPLYDRHNQSLWEQLERKEITRSELLKSRFRLFFEQNGITGVDPDAFTGYYANALSGGYCLVENALSVLTALKPHFQLAIITNGTADVQKRRLSGAGIASFFSDIIISGEIGYEKPDPRFFERALFRCGVSDPSRALVVGDSLSADIAGGNGFGIDTCWYNPSGCPTPEEPRPTYVINSLNALPALLKTPALL